MSNATLSNTTSFGLEVHELIEEAQDGLGGEHVSADDARKARTKLNLILIELMNLGIPLHKIVDDTVTLSAGVNSYTLDTDVHDVLEAVTINTATSNAIPLNRISFKEFFEITNKTQTSDRPTVIATNRLLDNVLIDIWPTPSSSTSHTLKLKVAKKIMDVSAAYQKIDIPSRYLPYVTKKLRYEIAISREGIPEDIKARAERDYMKVEQPTFEEDKERVDFVIKPAHLGKV